MIDPFMFFLPWRESCRYAAKYEVNKNRSFISMGTKSEAGSGNPPGNITGNLPLPPRSFPADVMDTRRLFKLYAFTLHALHVSVVVSIERTEPIAEGIQ